MRHLLVPMQKRPGPVQPVTPRADTLETAARVLASTGWGTKTLEHKTNEFRSSDNQWTFASVDTKCPGHV